MGVRGAEEVGDGSCAKVSTLGELRRLARWCFCLPPPRLKRETLDPPLDLLAHAHANFLDGVGGWFVCLEAVRRGRMSPSYELDGDREGRPLLHGGDEANGASVHRDSSPV